MPEPLFDFYEKVLIQSNRPQLEEINGKLAAIIGRAPNDNGQWIYALHIHERGEYVRCCNEGEIQATGESDVRESFYDGTSIRVDSNGKNV